DDDCGSGSATYFYRDGPAQYWYVHTSANKAYNNCHVWTTTVTSEVVNSGYWYLPVSDSYTGDYRVWAYIACEKTSNHFGARDARYHRYRHGTTGGITETYHLNQKSTVDNCTTDSVQKNITALGDGSGYDHFAKGGYMRLVDRSFYCCENISWDMIDYSVRH
ncbi:MAG: hypothetical protein M3198_16575, partial [Actinomycetota bacterium]|nr:hypothetical protein [Actinomycetota bacterium]